MSAAAAAAEALDSRSVTLDELSVTQLHKSGCGRLRRRRRCRQQKSRYKASDRRHSSNIGDTHVASKTVAELNLQVDESFKLSTVKKDKGLARIIISFKEISAILINPFD